MPAITKRVTRLSDGRELIYFDGADTALGPGRAPVPVLRVRRRHSAGGRRGAAAGGAR